MKNAETTFFTGRLHRGQWVSGGALIGRCTVNLCFPLGQPGSRCSYSYSGIGHLRPCCMFYNNLAHEDADNKFGKVLLFWCAI